MRHKRQEFTENQKAEIFVRDRATCAFSGISLWFLDNGIKSNWQVDWVDHIKPSAQGGGAELENGICASNLFNSKKKDNTSDNIYFVKNGKPTEHYLKVYGTPTKALVERLNRLRNLRPEDWFFNRSISGIFIGFNCRCDNEFKGLSYTRTDKYWFMSAWKRLQKYQKKRGPQSLLERGIVKDPIPFGSPELLMLENINNESDLYEWIEINYPIYRESYKAFFNYFNMDSIQDSNSFILELENNIYLHPDVKKAIKTHISM